MSVTNQFICIETFEWHGKYNVAWFHSSIDGTYCLNERSLRAKIQYLDNGNMSEEQKALKALEEQKQ